MSATLSRPGPLSNLTPEEAAATTNRKATIALWSLLVAFMVFVAVNARRGAVAERIANPNVRGAPRPVKPLFGFEHWLAVLQIGTLLFAAGLFVAVVVAWRRSPRNPTLMMVIVVTLLSFQDPMGNWAPYAVYNPQLWHWPETWPLFSLSPTIEPFLSVGYAFFFVGPYFIANNILRRIQARKSVSSFAWRHPLLSLAGIILVVGFLIDAMLEMFLVRTQMYIYSQVIPWGSVFAGTPNQFPLIWESSTICLVMISAGVLLYRDDTGRSQAEKLAQKIRGFDRHPALATFAVMFVIINVANLIYIGGFAIVRGTKLATSVACPYPYPEAKVYDPNGFYEQAGQPGPYFAGIWSGWPSLQPDGRPHLTPPSNGGRCKEDHD